MERCETHDRYNCHSYKCRTDVNKTSNAGTTSINTDGNIAVGLGSDLAIDLADGSLGFQIAPGIVVDF